MVKGYFMRTKFHNRVYIEREGRKVVAYHKCDDGVTVKIKKNQFTISRIGLEDTTFDLSDAIKITIYLTD
jgi:hypothetical protein